MRPVRRLALALLILALAATVLAGFSTLATRWPLRLGVLLFLPILAGWIGSALLPRSARRLGQSARVRGTARFHLLIALAVVLDPLAFVVGRLLGWVSLAAPAPPQLGWRLLALAVAPPLTIAAATLGSEWALRARLWSVGARLGRGLEAGVLSVLCGAALTLPALAPGFGLGERSTMLYAGIGVALLRQTVALALFRGGGLFVAGAYSGSLAALDGFGIGERTSLYAPLLRFTPVHPGFEILRLLGPAVALVVVALAARRQKVAS